METEIISKLFLELSQFTTAKTRTELRLEKELENAKSVRSGVILCQHKGLYQLLNKETIKKLGGCGNIWYCPNCGRWKHIDLDGTERWTQPPKLLME